MLNGRRQRRQRPHAPDTDQPLAAGFLSRGAPAIPPVGGRIASGSLEQLRRRRLELAERVACLTWDLGGLTYEMAVRDHYRLDVLARRAAELQDADAQLGELERLLGAAEAGVHGQCRSCGAVHSRGAAYCWHCGSPLLTEARPSVLPDISNQSQGSRLAATDLHPANADSHLATAEEKLAGSRVNDRAVPLNDHSAPPNDRPTPPNDRPTPPEGGPS